MCIKVRIWLKSHGLLLWWKAAFLQSKNYVFYTIGYAQVIQTGIPITYVHFTWSDLLRSAWFQDKIGLLSSVKWLAHILGRLWSQIQDLISYLRVFGNIPNILRVSFVQIIFRRAHFRRRMLHGKLPSLTEDSKLRPHDQRPQTAPSALEMLIPVSPN